MSDLHWDTIHRFKLRSHGLALLGARDRASWIEVTARWRIDRRWHIALENDPLFTAEADRESESPRAAPSYRDASD